MANFKEWYPFFTAMIAFIVAQGSKPFFTFLFTKEWKWRLINGSGGFPSSHTATVSALALSVGLQEHFSSTLFSVTLVYAVIVAYDAMNVRYYAGQNIKITNQLIKDLQELTQLKFDDPIYMTKMKDVLGHKTIEVLGGCILGIIVALLFYPIS